MFACGRHTIVTARTGISDTAMIEGGIAPADRAMADITLFVGGDMCRMHARGNATVMA